MNRHTCLILIALLVVAPSLAGGTLTGLTPAKIGNAPKLLGSTTAGPDGNVWFTTGNTVGRLTPSGDIKEFTLSDALGFPDSITSGLDGNLWLAQQGAQTGATLGPGAIAKVTTSGVVKEFPLAVHLSFPTAITSGADGALWFFVHQFAFPPSPPANWKLGRMTTDGLFASYDLGSTDTLSAMVAGPDGNLWLYDSTKNAIVRFSIKKRAISGTYAIPSPANDNPIQMVVARDGNIWFTHGNSLDRIKTDGTITEYRVPTANGNPSALVVGGDGNLWFTEYSGQRVGQLILSSATDGGTATINESDAVLEQGGVEMIPLATTPRNTASNLRDTLGVISAPDPCTTQTFVVRFTILGTWYELKFTTDVQNRCADLDVGGQIGFMKVTSRSDFVTGKYVLNCTVTNEGPSAATNMVATCHTVGGSMTAQDSKTKGPCTFLPDPYGMTIKADSLANGSQCSVDSGFEPGNDGLYIVTIIAGSDTLDPFMKNNGYTTTWDDEKKSVTLTKPFVPATNPAARGH